MGEGLKRACAAARRSRCKHTGEIAVMPDRPRVGASLRVSCAKCGARGWLTVAPVFDGALAKESRDGR